MKITLKQIKAMLPTMTQDETWLSIANEMLEKYEINTADRIAGFFAQAGHESADMRVLTENLNYTWQRLRQVFPRYFKTDTIAKQHDRNPQKIANRVYDDALRVAKLGNVKAGDGWLFRGRRHFSTNWPLEL